MSKLFNQMRDELKYEIIGLAFLAAALFGLISLFTSSGATGGAGAVGAFLVQLLSLLAGAGKYLLPLFLAFLGIRIMRERKDFKVTGKNLGLLGIFLFLLTFFHLQLPPGQTEWQAGWQGEGGGLIGATLAYTLKSLFGLIGSYVILSALFISALLITFNLSLVQIFGQATGWWKGKGQKISEFFFTVVEEDEQLPKKSRSKKGKTTEKPLPEPEGGEPRDAGWLAQIGMGDKPSKGRRKKDNFEVPLIIDGSQQAPVEQEKIAMLEEVAPVDVPFVPEPIEEEKPPQLGLEEDGEDSFSQPIKEEVDDYRLPPLSLLQRPVKGAAGRYNQDVAENARVLEETLDSFGVKVKVTQVSRGPAITRYELQPAPGVKVSRITNLADDLALNLAAPAVRIEAPIPGKAAVGIEVPNKETSPVHFREVLETDSFQNSPSKLTVALGKDIAGNPIVAELNKMPHLLIAGSTGSGKSVCMNSLICSILFKAKPNEVKFLMVDPKMVELTTYNGIPHLIAPVVTDAKKAATALRWIVNEMENRYEIFASNGVKDITRYNLLKAQENPDSTQPAMAYVVVLIDELADLMMVAPVDVEDAICRLAQMARAAGIHLVVATQRPSVNVITGVIKANIPSRIAFAVSSQVDSRTIIDMAGAEKLLGRGDMLFNPVGASKPLRAQGVFVSDQEVDSLVEFLKNQGTPEYEEGVLKAQENVETVEEEEDDELFVEAVRVLLDSGQASISMLQRRLRVGYARAARLIDIMEQRSIVGGYEGSKPREILISRSQFEQRYGSDQSNTGS